MRIRNAGGVDIDAIVALERATQHAPHWQREAYAEMVRAGEGHLRRMLVVAEDVGGVVIGFAAGAVHMALEDSAVLESVCVASAVRRVGVGRALCEAVFAWCRSLGATRMELEVRAGNAAAIGLYTRLGFVEVGRRREYYADPVEDAVLLRIGLTGSQTGREG